MIDSTNIIDFTKYLFEPICVETAQAIKQEIGLQIQELIRTRKIIIFEELKLIDLSSEIDLSIVQFIPYGCSKIPYANDDGWKIFDNINRQLYRITFLGDKDFYTGEGYTISIGVKTSLTIIRNNNDE